MKVNMTPNPLDVVTIHASQGDTEARQWEFELHNNGELIDTSDVKEQLVFKAYKGGTEQLLPENGSTPTTSPFKGDIRYPQGLLSDQEFTYRQSPTEEDGLAKIADIKGNTLVWNQLFNTIPSSSSDGITTEYNATTHLFSITNNNRTSNYSSGSTRGNMNFSFVKDHKYFIRSSKDVLGVVIGESGGVFHALNTIFTAVADYDTPYIRITYQYDFVTAHPVGDVTSFYLNVFDLTTMGLDSLTVEEFTSLFPLPYYSYNQGSLLSFNGNGIKTVGKNLFDFSQFANGTITFENGILTGTAGQFYSAVGIDLVYPKNTQITISFDARTEQNQASTGGGVYLISNENGTPVQLVTTFNSTTAIQHKTITIPSNRHIDKLGWAYGSASQNIWHITNFQVEFGTETSFEPYTSSTLSLPISTYFPTGMKSAGNVYDELTESKAITRIGSVDLGSLTWEYRTTGSVYAPYFYASFTGIKPNGNPNVRKANILCSKYSTANRSQNVFIDKTICADGSSTELTQLQIKDSSFTDVTAFKNSLQGQYLYYELATPTETSFTTASLVTENGEIPLSNEDGVLIGKCTEQLSENPGFIDAKIKLSDADGECYSNKIQLHVERSPQ